MKNKINILREMIEAKKPKVLSEGIKIFKSKPFDSYKIYNEKKRQYETKGPGYWLYISSDSPEGNTFKDEALHMSSILKLSKNKKFDFIKENPGVARLKQFKDENTKQFGWGYYVEDYFKERDPGLEPKRLDWLKGLVRKYNTTKNLEDDVKTGNLTIDQVEQIQDLVSEIQDASEMNPETKAKLEKYLDELTVAVENDEVFEFLTKKYSEAKDFIRNNIRAGSTSEAWPYTVTNAIIIRAADPDAVLAGQEMFWRGRGYRLKQGARGISIWLPRTTRTQITAKNLERNPEAFAAYKQKHGINPSASPKDVMKLNRDLHATGMAHQAIKSGAVRTQFGRNEMTFGLVYTDTMVEPVPGEEVMSIQDMIGEKDGNEPIVDPFHISQKELDSEEHKEKLNVLFKAAIDVADADQINTQGIEFKDGDINEFNKLINTIAFDKAEKELPSKMGVKPPFSPQVEEMIHGYSEVISNLVKRNYGLPSEESKYNIARQGIDREEMQKVYSEIVRISDKIIQKIDKLVSTEGAALNEVRKIVRSVLRNI